MSKRKVDFRFGHLAALDYLVLSVGFGSISESQGELLDVRYVPEAEVNPRALNVGFGEFTTGEYR